ncbi:MAG: hypothetical protein FVQ82_04045 [Planctomycetes bacterium]|nr:hypothetical protein [Planctomycetota bacterium]
MENNNVTDLQQTSESKGEIIIQSRRGRKVFPWFRFAMSLMLVVVIWLILQVLPSFLSPGVIPQPLQKIIYSPGSFWQNYDSSGLVDTNFHGSSFLGGSGWLYFKSDKPETYNVDDVISFAEKNGWVYHGKTLIKTQVFTDHFIEGRLDWEKDIDESQIAFWGMYITYFQRIPFKIQRDCTIIAFEAFKPHYVMVSSDGKEMEVRVITYHFPDPPIAIPEDFKK